MRRSFTGRIVIFQAERFAKKQVASFDSCQHFTGLDLGETDANPADHPSRFRAIRPPLPVPRWLRRLGVKTVKKVGWELFAGTARLTKAHLDLGIPMLGPVDVLFGSDIFAPGIERTLR